MGKHRIRYTRAAIDDLDSIFDYIDEGNRDAAVRMLNRLEQAILRLAENPRLGAVLPTNDRSLVSPGYRRLVVSPYLVFYRIGEEEIMVARVLHARQDWMHLLFERFVDE